MMARETDARDRGIILVEFGSIIMILSALFLLHGLLGQLLFALGFVVNIAGAVVYTWTAS